MLCIYDCDALNYRYPSQAPLERGGGESEGSRGSEAPQKIPDAVGSFLDGALLHGRTNWLLHVAHILYLYVVCVYHAKVTLGY